MNIVGDSFGKHRIYSGWIKKKPNFNMFSPEPNWMDELFLSKQYLGSFTGMVLGVEHTGGHPGLELRKHLIWYWWTPISQAGLSKWMVKKGQFWGLIIFIVQFSWIRSLMHWNSIISRKDSSRPDSQHWRLAFSWWFCPSGDVVRQVRFRANKRWALEGCSYLWILWKNTFLAQWIRYYIKEGSCSFNALGYSS